YLSYLCSYPLLLGHRSSCTELLTDISIEPGLLNSVAMTILSDTLTSTLSFIPKEMTNFL
ncbi:hypothetical protein BX616_006863, partial [Lobosporangium transversale]